MDWKAIEAACDQAVIGAFGEMVRHVPISNGKADPDRAAAEIRGVLHTPTIDGTISLGNGIVTTFSGAESALVINRADFPDLVLRKRDRIVGTELPGEPTWEIKAVNDRFSGILVVALNQA